MPRMRVVATSTSTCRGSAIRRRPPGAADPTAEFDSSKIDDNYNMLRHAGTSFSLAQAGGASEDKRYFEAARKGIEFLIGISRADPLVQGDHLAVVDKGATKVGGNGLALVALAEYTKLSGDTQFVPDAVRYGEWLVQTQHDNGDWPHKRDIRTGKVTFKKGKEWKSGYYPGEAILGLVRLYEINEDPKWLDTAEKATRFLIDVRDKGRPIRELEPDHWLLYGLEALHKHRPDDVFVAHANKIIDRILGDQTLDQKDPGQLRRFWGSPRSCDPGGDPRGGPGGCPQAADSGPGRADETRSGCVRDRPRAQVHAPAPARSAAHHDVRQRSHLRWCLQ